MINLLRFLAFVLKELLKHRVGGGVTPAVLPHHRAYGSVHGGSRSVLKTMELIHITEQSRF